jgi:hypothetical protein
MTFDSLILSLPTRNSTMRMRVWRALKETGCGVLRDGLYVLPSGSAGSTMLAGLESEIRSAGGFAMNVELKVRTAGHLAEVRKLFDRSADYGALVRKINAARSALPRLGARRGQTAIDRLERSFGKLADIDFFPGQGKLQAAEALTSLKRSFHESYTGGEPRASRKRLRPLSRSIYEKRTWATRKNLWVDRMASAWLIKRFIDKEAKFLWLEKPRDCPKRAVGFDFDGAEFTHADNRVTFEVLLATFGLEGNPGLAAIGASVHFLDVGGIPVADAKGLETVLKGAKEKARNDDALLADAIRILDLFYSAYSQPKSS